MTPTFGEAPGVGSVIVSGRNGVLRFSETHGWLWVPASQFALADQQCHLLHCRVLDVDAIRKFFADPDATFDGFTARVAP